MKRGLVLLALYAGCAAAVVQIPLKVGKLRDREDGGCGKAGKAGSKGRRW